jgi:hypothetical protein
MTDQSDEPEHTDGVESSEQPSGRSRYEDFDLSVKPPLPRAVGRRTPTLTVAAVVLGFSGVLPLLTVFLFHVGGTAAVALAVLGVLELTAAALVAMLRPIGRPIGIALGCLGLVLGIVSARTSPANGLVTMGLNGFVIYALASSGPAFRRG